LLIVVLAGVLVAAGCGDSRDESDDGGSAAGGRADAPGEGGSGEGGGGAATADLVTTGRERPQGAPLQAERSVIYTGELRVRVENRTEAASRAIDEAEAAGGLLFDQTADLEGAGDAVVTVKVPPERFAAVLDALAALGDPIEQEVKARDVTDQVVDLEGRLETAQTSADRLRTLLAEAPNVAGVVAVEAELARREAEIESLEGELRLLESQTELATITARFTERRRTAVEVDDDIPGFLQGLRRGWVALVNTLAVVATVAGFGLPFLLLLLPAALVLRWAVRRTRVRPAT
jgi:hypothetical protein